MSYGTRCRMRKNSGALPFYAVLSALALLLFCASSALADTLTVPSAAYPTIQAAIDAAQDGDTIDVAAGTYVENLVWENKSIALTGAGADVTIIDGNGAGSCLVMRDVPDSASVEGFTFTGGTGTDVSWTFLGGGLFLERSSATLRANIVTGNSAGYGGGIACTENSSPEISDNTISGNTVSSAGGGILCRRGSSPTITGNTISENSAQGNGGGVELWGSSAEISNNAITGNTALAGGGIRACAGGSPRITGNIISGNSVHRTPEWGAYGGGIRCGGCSAEITNNIITDNWAESGAGAIWCVECPSAVISGNTITGNSAEWAGGVACTRCPAVELVGNTISGNSAGGNAGGIRTVNSTVLIVGNTISGNSAESSAGITCDGCSVTITNNTISENSADGWTGGLACGNSSGTISGNTITRNSAKRYAGIECWDSSLRITNNIISENSASGGVWSIGGGIAYFRGPSGTLDHNTITGNSAESAGGGVYCHGSSLTISDNTITGNTAGHGQGGGILCSNSSPTITGNTISENSGAAISIWDNSSPHIANNVITHNIWIGGAAIWLGGASVAVIMENTISENSAEGIALRSNSSATITDNEISWNSGATAYGTGISSLTAAPVTISNNTITDNSTGHAGGGIAFGYSSEMTITGNVISRNSAPRFGGMDCFGASGVFANNTVSDNVTTEDGAGIRFAQCEVTISGNTITGNTAGTKGGGIECSGCVVRIEDNTIRGNSAGTYGGGIRWWYSSGTIEGNSITGNSAHWGAAIWSGESSGMITNNTIASNDGDAVTVGGGTGLAIRSNCIFANEGLGIDLGDDGVTPNDVGDADSGPNNLQNFPELVAAASSPVSTVVRGVLDSTANTTFTLDFYANTEADPSGYGEGETPIGSTTVTTDGGGIAEFTVTLPVGVQRPALTTATATDPEGNTSEFSAIYVTVVTIDIKPGSDPNSINLGAQGVVPVAILTTPDFDAVLVDEFSLTLSGSEVRLKGKSGQAGSMEDVDGDGLLDLVVQFYIDMLDLEVGGHRGRAGGLYLRRYTHHRLRLD